MVKAPKFVTAGVILAAASGSMLLGSGATLAVEEAASSETTMGNGAALVMSQPDPVLAAAGWTQTGSASRVEADGSGFGQLDHLNVVGDLLVALGATLETAEDGPMHDAVFNSVDGQTWTPVYLPGTDPVLNDMASTANGLIVGGYDQLDGEDVARLWSSADGLEWTEIPAPEGAEAIDQIVSAEDPLVVRANESIFSLGDDGAWTDRGDNPNTQVMRGPGGYLFWQGGGQDEIMALFILQQATLDSPISEVPTPREIRTRPATYTGVQMFVVDDKWVMVPDGYESPIFVSTDGLDWTAIPRPKRMLGGYVEWMAMVDGQLQAFGIQHGKNGSPSGIWTIDLASDKPAPFKAVHETGDQHMGAPVAFGDGYVATGLFTGRDSALTSWAHEMTAEMAAETTSATTSEEAAE